METHNEDQSDLIELEQGTYWRALEEIPQEHITTGMVLLLQSIRDVDNRAHTIILRAHPSLYGRTVKTESKGEDGQVKSWYHRELTEHRFLVADFLRLFVLEPDYARIRQEEVSALQSRITDLQNELALTDTASTPDLTEHINQGLRQWEEKKQLPAGSSDAVASTQMVPLSTALTADKVEEMKLAGERQHEIATLKANFIKLRSDEIAATATAMVPFFQERAAGALAKTEDVRRYVAKLQSGIQSLDLYVGTGVSVLRIREGESAPPEEKLTIMQRKLFADEELSVFADVDETFDHSKIETFFKALAKRPGLVNQIFPTPRCIVAYAATDRERDYGDVFTNDIRNALNKQVGLLVRDGGNIFVVSSPIDSHLLANNLFPSKSEIDAIFRESPEWWEREKGKKGREITFNDVRYTDRLTQHEALALHYKRFMILLAGLDHRENLFGTFYNEPKGMDFVSMGFQKQYMRFIHDAESERLLEIQRPSYDDWAQVKNSYLRPGSRVFSTWENIMTPTTAPGAVVEDGKYNRWKGKPVEKTGVAIAYQQGREMFVSIPVRSEKWDSKRVYDAKVNLSKVHPCWEVRYLVLDAVKPEELEAYIYDRNARKDHLNYIQFFKRAVRFLREEREREALTRKALADALMAGDGLAGVTEALRNTTADQMVDKAVIAWRASNKGAALPDFTKIADDPDAKAAWFSLLNHMWDQVKGEEYATAAAIYAKDAGLKPLRLVLTGNNKIRLYCAPRASERDDRLTPHVWVHAIDFTARKKRSVISQTAQAWVELPRFAASDTTLNEWPGVEKWAGLTDPLPGPDSKAALFAVPAQFAEWMKFFFDPQRRDMVIEDWKRVRQEIHQGKWVRNPDLHIPLGVVYDHKRYFFLCLENSFPDHWLYATAPTPEQQIAFHDAFVSLYRSKLVNSEALIEKAPRHPRDWSFTMMEVNLWDEPFGDQKTRGTGIHQSAASDSMTRHLKEIVRKWSEKDSGTKLIIDPAVMSQVPNHVSSKGGAVWFDFDPVLGLDARVRTHAVVRLDFTKPHAKFSEVIMILPIDPEEGSSPLQIAERAHISSFSHLGFYIREDGKFYSYNEARQHVLEMADVIPQPDNPDFPKPENPGVEYWFKLPQSPEPEPVEDDSDLDPE